MSIRANIPVTLNDQASHPTPIADTGLLYAKTVESVAQLHYLDETGAISQLTGTGISGASTAGVWTPGPLWTFDGSPTGVCWSDEVGLFVCVGADSGVTTGTIFTSPDGVTWTQRTCPAGIEALYRITYAPGINLFCAVGRTTGAAPTVVTSTDGITWTRHDVGLGNDYTDIATNGSLLVITGLPNVIASSTDGITWTARTVTGADANDEWNRVTWSGSLFVAVGRRQQTDGAKVATSANGTSWSRGTIIGGVKDYDFQGVAYNASQGLYAALGANLTDSVGSGFTSPDGTTWTVITNPLSGAETWRSARSTGRVFLASADTTPSIWVSTDGKKWLKRVDVFTADISDFAAGYRSVVAVGADDVQWTSP